MKKKYIIIIVIIIVFIMNYYSKTIIENIRIIKLDNNTIEDIQEELYETYTNDYNLKKYYLAIGETYKIPKENIDYTSTNTNVATVDNNIVTAKSIGTTDIISETNEEITRIIVTDLIIKPVYNIDKEIIPCNIYTFEEAELLDEILKNRIENKGLKTRAAAIEAVRFLTLSLEYKIPYFFENGRLNSLDRKYIDGEGRYYKEGLYLSESKKDEIIASTDEPAIWGCPLTNYDDTFGWTIGEDYPNGLDCSGFITWVFYNIGIDVGDIGAGINNEYDDLSDLGIMHELTYEYINNKEYKVGDLIGRDGHIAMISGIDSEYIYISESFDNGVVTEKFSYKDENSELYSLYEYINTLDDIYESDGDYSDMW